MNAPVLEGHSAVTIPHPLPAAPFLAKNLSQVNIEALKKINRFNGDEVITANAGGLLFVEVVCWCRVCA
jgi:hypothetical protein